MANLDEVNDLIDAAVREHEKARRLLKDDPELIRARRGLGETALHFLAVEGYADAVRFLAEAGADVNATNEFGDTPLIDVATLGNTEVAKVLLASGADPNAQSITRDNVLHCAVESGNASLVDLLLVSGAKADYVTELGKTIADALPLSPRTRQEITDVLERHGVSLQVHEPPPERDG